MEDITDTDYAQSKRAWKEFQIEHLGEFHDLYFESDTFLLAEVSENFRNICLKIYDLDLARFFTATGLAWRVALKKAKAKSDILANTDMSLMIEKGIRWGISYSIYRYVKANNKYLKDYDNCW